MGNFIDLTGQKFNKLTAISYDKHSRKWWWLCECGNKKLIKSGDVKNGKTKSCGCHNKGSRDYRIKSIVGQKFGMLTVVKYAYTKNFSTYWECICDCGTPKIISKPNLLSGKTKSCGCLTKELSSRPTVDYVGKRFGHLVVNKYIGQSKWLCKCDCGKPHITATSNLKRGKLVSCGCIKPERTHNVKTHKMSGTRFYRIWQNIKTRCTNNLSPNYKNYGGRGIKCEWNSFEDFYNDMYESYQKHCEEFGEKNTSIDRIDVNDNYSKENCRWSTRKEQSNNKRNNHLIKLNGKEITVMEASEITGINYRTILWRLSRERDIYGKAQRS